MPKEKISIVLIEDNRILRDGISLMLKEQPDFKLISSVSDREESLPVILKLKPDVVLLDLGLRNQNSLDIVAGVKKNSSETKVIVMDLLPVQSDIYEFVKAGASGFILKDAMVSEFLKTIRYVAEGKKVLPPHMTGSLFSQIVERVVNGGNNPDLMDYVKMTTREKQVIELISEGMTNKEIGLALNLSHFTVKSHVHNILEKMALHSRIQIAKYSFSNKESKKPSGDKSD